MSRNNEIRRSMLTELLEGQPARKKQKTSIIAPVSTLLLNGQRALEDKRFNDAVTSFTDAIGNIGDRKGDLLHLYDHRSSAFIKIGNTDSALKDAKQMIRLDRSDHRGYLKCAQIERSRGNLKGAIRVCEGGLSSLDPHDKMRQSLETYLLRSKEAQRSQIIFEKGTDPMEVLPSELLAQVLSFFDYREVTAVMRVCKAWYNRLRATDLITQGIDTRSSRKTLKHEHIKSAFSRLGKTPRRLCLSKLNENAAYFASSQLKMWIRWESVRTLCIDDAKITVPQMRWEKFEHLQEIILAQITLPIGSIEGILNRCPVLEHATMICRFILPQEIPSESSLLFVEDGRLRSLTLRSTGPSPLRIKFDDKRPLSPYLERLDLGNVRLDNDTDLSMHSKLTDLALRETRIADQRHIRTPTSLENFILEGPFANIFPQPEEIRMPATNIRSLDLKGEHSIKCLAYLIRQGLSRTHLCSVSMSNFVSGTMVGSRHFQNDLTLLTTIPGREEFCNVEHLSLRDDNIRDKDRPVIFGLFPRVRYVELESCSITEEIVTEQIKLGASIIKSVTFRNCPQVSQDVDRWAIARKVDVKHIRQGTPSAVTTGRRVRYE